MMKKMMVFCILLFLVHLSAAVAKDVERKAGPEKKQTIYQVLWSSDNITGAMHVNGFLINTFNGSESSGTMPLNPWLMGKNQILSELQKADKSKPARFTLGVSELAPGDAAATNYRGNLVSAEISDNDFSKSSSVLLSKKFNSILDFSRHLNGAGAATEKDVVEYAKKIYALFRAKDAEGILKEFAVKLDDYSKAFSRENFRTEFKSYLTGELFKGALVKIDPQKLQVLKEGPSKNIFRVAEEGKALIRTVSPDGSTNEMDVYIGVVGGKLKVVR
jgi:hypothetical protein